MQNVVFTLLVVLYFLVSVSFHHYLFRRRRFFEKKHNSLVQAKAWVLCTHCQFLRFVFLILCQTWKICSFSLFLIYHFCMIDLSFTLHSEYWIYWSCILKILFHSSHFSFLVTFGDEFTKIGKYYVLFVYILQGKIGKTERKSRN